MALNLVSPGVKVREVDLTIGRIDGINDQVGAIAGPFAQGPVGVPILVETEQDLLNTFGKPYSADSQYEYWHTASSYLSYGGVLRVIRTDGAGLSNANIPVGVAVTDLKVTSSEDYFTNHAEAGGDWYYAARNPGSWANGIKVCVIDGLADQRLGVGTDGLAVGYALTAGFSTSVANSDGTVGVHTGFIKGIITQINVGSIDVKLTSRYNGTTDMWESINYEEGSSTAAFQGYDDRFLVGINTLGLDNFENRYRIYDNAGAEQQVERYRFGGSVGSASSIVSLDSFDSRYITFGDTLKSLNGTLQATVVGFTTDASPGVILSQTAGVGMANTTFIVKSGIGTGLMLTNVNTAVDWYNQQHLGLPIPPYIGRISLLVLVLPSTQLREVAIMTKYTLLLLTITEKFLEPLEQSSKSGLDFLRLQMQRSPHPQISTTRTTLQTSPTVSTLVLHILVSVLDSPLLVVTP